MENAQRQLQELESLACILSPEEFTITTPKALDAIKVRHKQATNIYFELFFVNFLKASSRVQQ